MSIVYSEPSENVSVRFRVGPPGLVTRPEKGYSLGTADLLATKASLATKPNETKLATAIESRWATQLGDEIGEGYSLGTADLLATKASLATKPNETKLATAIESQCGGPCSAGVGPHLDPAYPYSCSTEA